jgi:hypothetical protein
MATRREYLQGIGIGATVGVLGLDEDGDGKLLDDLLGLNSDRLGTRIPTFIAADAADAERIDPPKEPYAVYVLTGRLQGVHLITERDI